MLIAQVSDRNRVLGLHFRPKCELYVVTRVPAPYDRNYNLKVPLLLKYEV